jgi:hypothetical protein
MRELVHNPLPEPTHGQAESKGPNCKRCGSGNGPGAGRCSKCGCGLPGNALARKHGAYSREDCPELAQIRADAEAWTDDMRASQGGVDLAPVRCGAIANLGGLEYLKRLLIEDLKRGGIYTRSKKGGAPRVRSSFALLMQVLDRWKAYAQLLGLDSRKREVIETPIQWLERLQVEHEQLEDSNAHRPDASRDGQTEPAKQPHAIAPIPNH